MKKKIPANGIVFSTDPAFTPLDATEPEPVTLPPGEQRLKLRLETKHRAGKVVTLILGFIGNQADGEELVKKLKNHCGTGGAAKDGELLIQGDQRQRILTFLLKLGFSHTKII